MNIIKIGAAVPDFEALSTGNKVIKLADYRGKYVVIYFYPKDNTPAVSGRPEFRDNIDKLPRWVRYIRCIRDTVRVHEALNVNRHSLLTCFQTRMKNCANCLM